MKAAVAQLKDAHDSTTESFRGKHLQDRAACRAPNRIGGADEGEQHQRERERRRETKKREAGAVEQSRNAQNPTLAGSLAHGDKEGRADDCAKPARRLQEAEAGRADAKYVAGQNGQQSMVDTENGFFGWQVETSYFSLLQHSEMGGNTKDPGRVMLNFETTQVKEEFERIKAAGATVIKEPYEMGGGWIATLADLDGNYFQLVTPMG